MNTRKIELNEEQEKIVYAPTEAILVKASAGTGKTRVLTERIIYLINECNLNPEEVLAITFTNKATDEMRERISAGIKNQYKMPDSIGTIHSAFNRILRENISLVDPRNPGYQIIDEEEQMALVYKCIKKVGGQIPSGSSHRKQLLIDFSKLKRGLEPEKIQLGDEYDLAWREYEKMIRRENKVDFDDILILSKKLLYEHEEIRNYWKNKYKTVFVDEIQDLDALKWELVSALCTPGETNFLAIGDPNQSIYLYDGAVENIFNEIKEFFGNIYEYTLTINYRSSHKIIELSNQVKNEDYGNIKTVNTEPGNINTTPTFSETIPEMISSGDLNKWAILYYTNKEGEAIAKHLIEKLIPLKINNFQLFKKTMVKNTVLMLKTIYFDNFKPLKELIWSSQILKLNRDLKREIIKISEKNEYSNLSPKENFLKGIRWKNLDSLSNPELSKLERFISFINEISEMNKDDLIPIIERCIEYLRKFLDENKEWIQEELENLETFQKWVEMMQHNSPSCERAQRILMNLQKYAEGEHQIYDSSITLSTIHSAKGLEWNKVLVLNYNSLKGFFEDKDKNKNLAYVAITRAKETLILEEELSADQ